MRNIPAYGPSYVKKKYLLIAAFLLLLALSCLRCGTEETPQEKGLASITVEKTKEYLETLADDKMEGRKAGSAGGAAAAEYIAARLRDAGISPYGESYFQEFDVDEVRQFAGQNAYLRPLPEGVASVRNVLGKMEGENPGEYVIIGAHYDHIGTNLHLPGDWIFNGADDNASGVSAVLQVAEAFASSGERPQRTIIFAFWDAEEIGMVGSFCFVTAFDDISKIKGYINLDMIGRDDKSGDSKVAYMYSDTTTAYDRLANEDIEEYGLSLETVTDNGTIMRDFFNFNTAGWNFSAADKGVIIFGSDHAPFMAADIPVFLFFTGFHPDYHKPSDHADRINMEKLTDISRLSYLALYRIANAGKKLES